MAESESGQPTDEEVAAALAAVRLAMRKCGRRGDGGSRWLRAGRIEAITAAPAPAGWSTAERPR